MTPDQQRQQGELRDLLAHHQRLRALFVVQREHRIDQVQGATRDIEEVDTQILRLLECQRDLEAEVERTEGRIRQ